MRHGNNCAIRPCELFGNRVIKVNHCAYHAAVQVAAQTEHRPGIGADRFAVERPCAGMTCGHDESGCAERVQKFGADDFGQGLVAERVGLCPCRGLGAPQAFVAVNGCRRHQPVHMRVVIQ